ncbi:MAG: hypothetical protein U0414_21745 [Polyangiaceae bacterium]
MRRFTLLIALVGLGSACVFDLSEYRASGEGGAPGAASATVGTNSGAGPASSASGPGSTSAGTGAATTSAESSSASTTTASGTGGGPVALAPCGGMTDDFQQFSSPPWFTHDTEQSGPTNKKYVQSTIGFDIYANAHLAGAEYHDCFASIDLVGFTGGSAYLRLYQGLLNQRSVSIDHGHTLHFPGGSQHVDGWPVALGLAFVGDQVFYSYASSAGAWEPPVAVEQRSDWMDDGADDELGFGVNGVINDSAAFDSFNMRPITYADLGIAP